MSDEMKIYPFGKGVPTSPDVLRIRKAFPDLKIGDRILYEKIEEIIHVSWRSSRFKSVTTAWVKEIKKSKGLIIGREPGQAFYVKNNEEVKGEHSKFLRHNERLAANQYSRIATVIPENDAEKVEIQHIMLQILRIKQIANECRKNILPPTEKQRAVMIAPPKSIKA
jgi:hypothetical protein